MQLYTTKLLNKIQLEINFKNVCIRIPLLTIKKHLSVVVGSPNICKRGKRAN